MSTKHYATDRAKSASRTLVRETIEKTLLTYRNPRDLQVLCFPGIDAQEIFEVYDPLGISRSNIIGIERDPQIASEIEQKKLGITLIKEPLEEYVQRLQHHRFDIISLDYIGPINVTQFQVIKKLCDSHSLDSFVLHCANLLRRDHNSTLFYNYGFCTGSGVLEEGEHFSEKFSAEQFNPAMLLSGMVSRLSIIIDKKIEGERITDEKKIAYSSLIRSCFSGASISSIEKYFRFAAGHRYDGILKTMEQGISKWLDQPFKFEQEDPLLKLAGSPIYPVVQTMLENAIHNCVKVDCQKYGINDPQIQFAIWLFLSDNAKTRKFFRPIELKCYSYISESGAPMIGDIYYLKHPKYYQEKISELARLVNYPHYFHLQNQHQGFKFLKLVEKTIQINYKFQTPKEIEQLSLNLNHRIFCGNSYKPKLTKERAIEEFRKGTSSSEVRQKYRNGQEFPLQQIKAHVTMGTYDSKELYHSKELYNSTENKDNSTDSNHPPEPKSSDVVTPNDRLTKEEVLDLIASNIPLEEILDTFPDSFTKGQLRAYKAHVTMGTYREQSTSK